MKYTIEPNKIIIKEVSEFNIDHILDCGQVFRYRKVGESYSLCAKNANCLLQNKNDCVIINTSYVSFFIDYFDLDTNYAQIKNELKRFNGLEQALDFGSGLRLLKQDPLEMIISFIISANNNIPRIKLIIGRLCEKLGENKGEYYAFPSLEALSSVDENFYKSIGAGYRAKYLEKVSKQLKVFNIEEIQKLDTCTARKKLTSLVGVGDKVADCILLFAFGKTDLFPMDTWSKKIYTNLGFEKTDNVKQMSTTLVSYFQKLSGYAQQYLYYYYRNLKIKV
jgi:N-glycosylase/DNA lyase